MSSFFKEFKKISQALRYKEQLASSDEERDLIQRQMELIREIASIVNKGEFITRKDARERFLFFIKSGLSYKATAEKYQTSATSVRVSMNNASKLIYEAVGKNTLPLINEGYVKEAKEILAMKNTDFCFKSLFSADVYRKLPKPENQDFSYEELMEEIDFLATYSLAGIDSGLKSINENKLACLIQMIQQTDLFSTMNELVLDYIQGKMSRFEFVCAMSKESGEYDV